MLAERRAESSTACPKETLNGLDVEAPRTQCINFGGHLAFGSRSRPGLLPKASVVKISKYVDTRTEHDVSGMKAAS